MKHLKKYDEHINEEFGIQEIGMIILSAFVGGAAIVVLGAIFLQHVIGPILDLFENSSDRLKFMKMVKIMKKHARNTKFLKHLLNASKLISHGERDPSAFELDKSRKEKANKELLFSELDKVLEPRDAKFIRNNYYLIDELYRKKKDEIDKIYQEQSIT